MKTSKRIQLGYEAFEGSLDALGIQDNAVFIFSPYKKLISDYSGYAVQVRRSSDDALRNFGFDKWGDIESTEILTWVGSGNDGFVRIVYNQVNSNYAYQTTDAEQPKIVAAGVFQTAGLKFDGSDDYMTVDKYTDVNITDHPLTIFSQLIKPDASTTIIVGINTDGSNAQFSFYTTTVPQSFNFKLNSTAIQQAYTTGTQENVMCVYKDGNTNAQMLKANSGTTTDDYSSTLTQYNFLNIGARSTNGTNTAHSFFFNGNLKTIIVFNSNEYENYSQLSDI